MNMKLTRLITSALCIAAILSSLSGIHAMPASGQTRGDVRYVKEGGTGDCSSWENACDLQDALSDDVSGDEIWVAAGTYYPTDGTDRTISFILEIGVAVYGGFVGTETERGQRDWVANPTILSGDIGAEDDSSDNSYHVVRAIDVDQNTVLDGFTITAGNANGEVDANSGGGMFNSNSSPTLANITFSNNLATIGGGMYNYHSNPSLAYMIFSGNFAQGTGTSDGGGGMLNEQSNPTLTNVTFSSNETWLRGGGMYNIQSSPALTNVTFFDNSATTGGGMYNDQSSPTLINVTFSANWAGVYGGGIFNTNYSSPFLTNVTFFGNGLTVGGYGGGGMFNQQSSPSLVSVILWKNTPDQLYSIDSTLDVTYSDIQGAVYPGDGNISGDPKLAPLADNGGFTKTHALALYFSPAIDNGSPTICPPTDQRGYLRPIDSNGDGNARCDMGAYEYGSFFPYYSYLPLIVK